MARSEQHVPDRFRNKVTAEFIQWKNPGQQLTGHFLGITSTRMRDGNEMKALRVRSEGKEIKASAPTTLLDLLAQVDPGTEIHVVYLGEDEPLERGQSGLKRFDLYTA